MDCQLEQRLKKIANTLRRHIITMNCYAGSGHPGGALSAVEILTYLYFREMNIGPELADDPNRDRFILSKGHGCMALYAALAEKGFFSKSEFRHLRHVNGMLQGHPDRLKTPGIEFNSGSLGQGFSFALGCALGAKLQNKKFRTYVLLGDGELNEGQVWEGMMFGAHHRLDNLVAIVDYNKLQSDDYCENVTALEPLMDKFKAFRWYAMEIDGHDFKDIANSLDRARKIKGMPTIILAHTIKGKGVSFMENNPKWHGSLCPCNREKEKAMEELACKEL